MLILTETTQYVRTKKKLLKKHSLSSESIEFTLSLFKDNRLNPILHYKKINCKKDKNRFSIRIQNSQYRILMTMNNDQIFLVCICDHDDYDARNKDC